MREKIPAVINGGALVELPYTGTLKEGQKTGGHRREACIITTDIVVNAEDVRKLIYTPDIFEVDITLNGEEIKAVIKDLQFQPVKDTLLHIDFLQVYPDKPIVMEVPVQIEGHAEGVKAGGKLTLSMRKLKVKAICSEIPERLVVNVDNLGLGKSLAVGELHYEGLELMNARMQWSAQCSSPVQPVAPQQRLPSNQASGCNYHIMSSAQEGMMFFIGIPAH